MNLENRIPLIVKIIEWAQKNKIKVEKLTREDFIRAVNSRS